MKILCRDRPRPIDILCRGADLGQAMNAHHLLFHGLMLIRTAMIALDVAVVVLVVAVGVAAAGRRWTGTR